MSVKREGCVTTRSYADGGVNQITHASEQAAIDYAESFLVAVKVPLPKTVKAKKPAKPPAKKVAAKTKRK